MTFYVNGIKEENNVKYNIEIVILAETLSIVRKLLEEIGIMIVAIKEYPQEAKKGGNRYFQVNLYDSLK
ncbi:MAG: hypothetical protein WC872_05135, partial [Candidatus Absconditabacterales bacterium]